MLTQLLILFPLCQSLSKRAQGFLRFSEMDMETTIKPCFLLEPVEKDSFGREWTRFCYVHANGVEEIVEFRREYTVDGWTYYVNQQLGHSTFDYRQEENIINCDTEGREIDGIGRDWERWCYTDSSPVQFERQSADQWTYVEDHRGGCQKCDWRRIVHPSPSPCNSADSDEQSAGDGQSSSEETTAAGSEESVQA